MPLPYYRQLAASVDLGRERAGVALGLRDGAILDLLGSGLLGSEIVALRASDLNVRERVGGLVVCQRPSGAGKVQLVELDGQASARLMAWIAAAEIEWRASVLLFEGLTRTALYRLVWRARRHLEGGR